MLDRFMQILDRFVTAYEMNAETYKAEVLQPMRYITWDEEGYKEHIEKHAKRVPVLKPTQYVAGDIEVKERGGGTISGI